MIRVSNLWRERLLGLVNFKYPRVFCRLASVAQKGGILFWIFFKTGESRWCFFFEPNELNWDVSKRVKNVRHSSPPGITNDINASRKNRQMEGACLVDVSSYC